MQETINNDIYLPLNSSSSCTRNIKVESCLLDDNHHQIRGELTTCRRDYEDEKLLIENQCIVIRLVICLEDNTITHAEFAMPVPGFPDVCEHLPLGPEPLIGLKIEQGITEKIRELYERTMTCSDLQILLRAMIQLIPAISAINGAFRIADESASAEEIPNALKTMSEAQHNVCHAYSDREGSIQHYIAKRDYDKVLSRIGNRISKRWKNYRRNQNTSEE